jgi:hypothetical protein
MAPKHVTRREFLKLSLLSLASLAFRNTAPVSPEGTRALTARARITAPISIYHEPDYNSEKIGILQRDRIVYIHEEIKSPHGPAANPRWYRLEIGYIHSAYTQRIDRTHLNYSIASIPEGGRLGEVTVPFTQSYRKLPDQWQKLYRLYYGAVFWITSLEEGPDGSTWYGLTDDRLRVVYCVPTSHIRPIDAEELTPLSPDVPPEDKRIELSITNQSLVAYEGSRVVFEAKVSTGVPMNGPSPNGIPTDTPNGNFHIQTKWPSRHMGDGVLTGDLDAYELPGVPWASFFHVHGIAFHGAYWHDNFGRKMSRGCVNMRPNDAKWLYRWSHPTPLPTDWHHIGYGTLVISA